MRKKLIALVAFQVVRELNQSHKKKFIVLRLGILPEIGQKKTGTQLYLSNHTKSYERERDKMINLE